MQTIANALVISFRERTDFTGRRRGSICVLADQPRMTALVMTTPPGQSALGNSQPCREYFASRPVLEGISARPQRLMSNLVGHQIRTKGIRICQRPYLPLLSCAPVFRPKSQELRLPQLPSHLQ